MNPLDYSFPRYLAAKKSVDDRALNQGVWEAFGKILASQAADAPLKILEIGAGIGVMLERMLEAGLLHHVQYLALDAEVDHTSHGRQRLRRWAQERGCLVSESEDEMVLRAAGQTVTIRFETADVFEFCRRQGASRSWDVLVAHAFLDLVDLSTALPKIFSLLKEGGFFYFTINFDGLTALEPVIFPDLDARLLELYHHSMDARRIEGRHAGDSRAGRHLFTALPQAGGHILAAGASDWVIFPRQGVYPVEEAYFLHFIVHFFEESLRGHPALDPQCFSAWIAERHAQIERGELVYIAHQIDFLGQVHPFKK